VANTESKVISAVLEDKQMHVLLQANVDNLLRTHNDVWEFVRNYFEQNQSVPPTSLVVEKFRDFEPVADIGATKHHLEELKSEFLSDSLKDMLRSAAEDIQGGSGSGALENLISGTSQLKKETSTIRDIDATDIDSAVAYFENLKSNRKLDPLELRRGCQALTTTCLLELCQVSWGCSWLIQVLENLGFLFILQFRPGSRGGLL